MASPKTAPLGDLDGEAVDRVLIRFSGRETLNRRFADDEPVTLAIRGRVRPISSFARKGEELQRTVTIELEAVFEPSLPMSDQLGTELQRIIDETQGRAALDFDATD
jgi:hypothetical protein